MTDHEDCTALAPLHAPGGSSPNSRAEAPPDCVAAQPIAAARTEAADDLVKQFANLRSLRSHA